MFHAHCVRLIQQCQGQCGLGLKDDLCRDMRPATALGVLRPFFRQIQTGRDGSRQRAFGIGAIDRDLAIRHFAQRARILAFDAHRMLALFGKAGVVKNQHAVAFGRQVLHHLDALAIQVRFVPDTSSRTRDSTGTLREDVSSRHLGQQALQALLIRVGHDRGERLAILGGMFQQQARHIALGRPAAFDAVKMRLKRCKKFCQFRQWFAGCLRKPLMFLHASQLTSVLPNFNTFANYGTTVAAAVG